MEIDMSDRERIALFPGSFDPVTRGHLDVIARAAGLFDRLVVAVLMNPEKRPLLPEEDRVALIVREVRRLRNVEVRSFGGLVVDLAARIGAGWIVRGVRSADDLAFELPMALSNRLCGRRPVETLFLPARAEHGFISSRLVRDIAREGGDLDAFVTPAVARKLRSLHRDRRPGGGGRRR
jgi:pantetheine-phosphate adenylyltransferase